MKAVRAKPADFELASSMLNFMRNFDHAAETQEILKQARAQATRLLAEEDKAFGLRAAPGRRARGRQELGGGRAALHRCR